MNKKKLIINFLFDKKNNWINKYISKKKFLKPNLSIRKYFNPKKIKDQEIIFVLGYTKKLSKNFLKKNKYVMIIHESALPKGKGFSPLQWQILDNRNKITTCLFLASDKFDSGDILYKDYILLNGSELYEELRQKQAATSIKLINKFLKNYPKIKLIKQKGKETFYKKRLPRDSELDVNKNIKSQFNNLRISNNDGWPCFFYYKNQKYILKIFKTKNAQTT
jgi:methionyl-tRNA formyltransferase